MEGRERGREVKKGEKTDERRKVEEDRRYELETNEKKNGEMKRRRGGNENKG